jgi:hypothetical protein
LASWRWCRAKVAFAVGARRAATADAIDRWPPSCGARRPGRVADAVVAVAAAAASWLLPAEWELMRRPFAIVAAGFVLAFPLRVFTALLQGCRISPTSARAARRVDRGHGHDHRVAFAGAGLYALAGGWVVSQLLPALVAWRRVAVAFPGVLPRRVARLSWSETRRSLGRGSWISVAQIAQVLLSGTDLDGGRALLGPEAIVPYACTGKLLSMLANQPQLFMQMALPALSELRGSAARARLFEVSRSMTQVMLLCQRRHRRAGAGGQRSVRVLVGRESRGSGPGAHGAALAGMLVRHVNVTIVYTLFCFGNERRSR